jgi:predicted PurR-regulated permease PerM
VISLNAVVRVVIYLVAAGLICYLLWWLLNFVNPPEPFKKVGAVVIAVVAVLIVIGVLLSLTGGGPVLAP